MQLLSVQGLLIIVLMNAWSVMGSVAAGLISEVINRVSLDTHNMKSYTVRSRFMCCHHGGHLGSS